MYRVAPPKKKSWLRRCANAYEHLRLLRISGDHFAIIANWWRIAFVSPFAIYSPLSGEFAANIFFYIRKDIRHYVRLALRVNDREATNVFGSPLQGGYQRVRLYDQKSGNQKHSVQHSSTQSSPLRIRS